MIAFVVGADGNLYGATEQGGSANQGVMYRLTPSGSFKVLHDFCSEAGCADKGGPFILGQDGNFYGAVFDTIFQLTPQGIYTVIYSLDPTFGNFSRGRWFRALTELSMALDRPVWNRGSFSA